MASPDAKNVGSEYNLRKIVSFLAVVLCMVFVFSTVCYAETLRSGDWLYEVDASGTVTITGYEGEDSTVEVPSVIDGRTVTAIAAKAFSGNAKLVSVILPDTIT